MSIPEAFLLLTLENATVVTPTFSQSGILNLECVSVQIPEAPSPLDRDVYLILRVGTVETPIDPARVIHRTDGQGYRKYTFHNTELDLVEMNVAFSLPTDHRSGSIFMEDLETFESILAQYADLRGLPDSAGQTSYPVGGSDVIGPGLLGSHGDLRGHLVVINEDTGEVVGQFDDSKFNIQEDPKLQQRGHEGDIVIIEIPDAVQADEGRTPMEIFVQTVPVDQQDWITKSATLISYAISQTTNLLLTTITTASDYYVSHSTPSPSHPCNSSTSRSTSTSTPPLPPRALVLLTSERTRRGLAGVHAVSGKAVQVSSKTVSIIDNMIRRAMGAQPKRPRAFLPNGSLPHAPSLPPRMLSPASLLPLSPRTSSLSSSGSYLVPPPNYYPTASPSPPFPNDKPALPPRRYPSPTPPQISRIEPGVTSAVIYAQHPSYSGSVAEPFFPDDKPPLPPRRSPSPGTVSFSSRTGTGAPTGVTPLPHHQLTTKDSVLLSADLILSTLDHSARQLLNGGTESVGAAVGHKYGPDAGHSSMLLAGTARNVGLVYVDMAGIGRRALLRRAGIQFVKGRLSS